MSTIVKTPTPERERRGRLGSKKSRSGCITCKIRRVKCDEGRPYCLRCTSTGRKCDGYASPEPREARAGECDIIVNKSSVIRVMHNFNPGATQGEKRAFDFYYGKAAPSITGVGDIDFWTRVVPQLCHSEPVIWDAVIAIGSFYENSINTRTVQPGKDAHAEAQYQLGIKWYNRAISRVNDFISKGNDIIPLALLSSILFVCIEVMQDNIPQTVALIKNCTTLLRHIYLTRRRNAIDLPTSPSIVEDAASIVRWLSSIPISFGDMGPAKVFEEITSRDITFAEGGTFSSLKEAQDALNSFTPRVYSIFRDAAIYKKDPDQAVPLKSIIAQRDIMKKLLEDWSAVFHQSSNLSSMEPLEQQDAAMTLKDHAVSTILIDSCFHSTETDFDAYFDIFEQILDYISVVLGFHHESQLNSGACQVPFRFESPVLPALCFVIRQCRHPRIRRRALSLIRMAPQKESLWKRDAVARVMTRVIVYEEAGCSLSEDMTLNPDEIILPPEENRVHYWKVLKDGWEISDDFARNSGCEEVMMMFMRYRIDENGIRREVTEVVPV